MGTNSKDLGKTLNTHYRSERRRTFAEACYWLSQYKELALRAVLYAEKADKELEHLRSFVKDITLKYEELRKLIDGGSESMTHADAVTELKSLLSAEAEPAKLRAAPAAPKLQVWFGSLPETNGKTNWTAILHRDNFYEGITIARSEYKDRVRYEADRMRWMIGELPEEPDILQYDANIHSGYTRPAVPAPEIPDGDDFNGTTSHLIQCIEALVRLDADSVLVPHGIGRSASRLLSAAANRLQQQAASSVPEEWREFVKRTAEVGLHATNSGVECTCYRCVAIRGARALLQSADHSEHVLEKEFRTSAKDSVV